VLVARLGLFGALRVGADIARRQRRREPFEHLPAPADAREDASRRQAAPAVLLYRALLDRMDRDAALEVTRAAVIAGAVRFLRSAIGPVRREVVGAMDDGARRVWAEALGARFFNATMRWDEVSPTQLRFTVTRCLFPGLCAAAGAPELAPLLCAGDEHYFGHVLPEVVLERPCTLAAGAPECRFELRFAAGEPE